MVESRIDKRRFIEIHRFTVLVFIALAGGRLLYIAACATPLEVDLSHLRYAAPALAIGTYYTFVRYRVVVAAVFNGLGLAAFSLTGNVMSSVLTVYTGRGFPLADEALNAADRLIGFDWIALLKLVDSYPFIDAILQAAYASLLAQMVLITAVLALTQQPERLYRFLMAANVTLGITCVIAIFFPALGTYEFLGISPADHSNIRLLPGSKMTAPILWLRAGEFSLPFPVFTVGLISFPSFHAASAIVYAWATWRTPFVRWIILGLNALMLAATPIHGSHYLVDLLAGIAVAMLSIGVTALMFDRFNSRIRRDRAVRADALAGS